MKNMNFPGLGKSKLMRGSWWQRCQRWLRGIPVVSFKTTAQEHAEYVLRPNFDPPRVRFADMNIVFLDEFEGMSEEGLEHYTDNHVLNQKGPEGMSLPPVVFLDEFVDEVEPAIRNAGQDLLVHTGTREEDKSRVSGLPYGPYIIPLVTTPAEVDAWYGECALCGYTKTEHGEYSHKDICNHFTPSGEGQ